MSYGLNRFLCLEGLELLQEQLKAQNRPGENYFKLKAIEDQIGWFFIGESHVSVAKHGGGHFGAVRQWIQWNAFNGSDVIWGSNDLVRLKVPVTPKLLEEIACTVAAGTLNDLKGLR